MVDINKKIIYILDTSSILSGKSINIDENKLITTLSVLDEIKPGGKDFRNLENLLEKGLITYEPTKKSIKNIIEISSKTGDFYRLSKTDIDILALAIDLNYQNENMVIILTDDYSIQNVCSYLKIKFSNISQSGITKRFKWSFKCRGCGKRFKKNVQICPICGSSIKTVISKAKKINQSL